MCCQCLACCLLPAVVQGAACLQGDAPKRSQPANQPLLPLTRPITFPPQTPPSFPKQYLAVKAATLEVQAQKGRVAKADVLRLPFHVDAQRMGR